ncbi:MAG TPA: hypothetical protein VF585_11170 [Chthoniobacterales bacterium]|jgi:hypothetical protein
MCHFITAIIPAEASLDLLRGVARDHALALTKIHNPHVEAQLTPSEHYYLTTSGSCDCGTVFGSRRRRERRSQASEPDERDVAALRRSGWSEAKIERWLSQRAVTVSRNSRTERVRAQSDELEAANWQHFLTEVLASGCTSIGILLHWYRGSYLHEKIQILSRHSVSVAKITPEFLTGLSEDELYVFTR